MDDWLATAYTSQTGWEHLKTLVDIGNRMAGTDGERRGAVATRDRLADLGARGTELTTFDVQGWERTDSAVTATGRSYDCIGLPRSPADDVTADLVDLGYGLPEDFAAADTEGAIVMVRSDIPDYHDRYIHRQEKYHHAVENGAVGFIYRNHVEGQLPPTGSLGTESEPIGAIPAVGVSYETGAQLARRHADEELTVSVEAEIYETTSQNVHATVGPDTDEQLLVTSHIDAHDIAEGAIDNGAGTAVLVHAAEALVDRAEELGTRVHFVACGAEEVGLVGSLVAADRLGHESIKAVVNNDGVARARTLQVDTQGFEALERAATAVSDRYNVPVTTNPRLGPHSDHWPFVRHGVPGCHLRSQTTGVGRGWGHTHADTLDKVDPRDVREHGIQVADLVVELAQDTVTTTPKTQSEIEAKLAAADQLQGLKITGQWPPA